MKHYTCKRELIAWHFKDQKMKKRKELSPGRPPCHQGEQIRTMTEWLAEAPALEEGIESIKALNKQSGFSVLNQFVQRLKLVGRGAPKACTQPLSNLSQPPQPGLCWLSVFHGNMAAPLGSEAERVEQGTETAGDRRECLPPRRAGSPPCRRKCWLLIPRREGLRVPSRE